MDEHMLKTLSELGKLSRDAALTARMDELLESAREAKKLGGEALAGVDPAVADVLARIDPDGTSFSSGSGEVRLLVKLGRQAVPGLLLAVSRCDAHSQASRAMTAADALRQLVNDGDAAELDRLVLGGSSSAAYATLGLSPGPAAKILAGAFDRDLVSLEATTVAARLRGQEKLVASVAAWIERHLGDTRPDKLADVVGVLGRIGDVRVLPLLRKVDAELPGNPENRWKVAAARLELGDPDAVSALLGFMKSNVHVRGTVGSLLDSVFRTVVPERVWPSRPGGMRDAAALDPESFEAWWAEERPRLSFNAEKRRWERAR
jgi:hypothetical protein